MREHRRIVQVYGFIVLIVNLLLWPVSRKRWKNYKVICTLFFYLIFFIIIFMRKGNQT